MSHGTNSRPKAVAWSNSLRAHRRENARARADGPSGGQNVRARAGGPPTLNVDPSCEAAGMGSVVLGRDKKACLGDETTAQDTLRQNWSKYAAADKSECIGIVTTGGPASYVGCCPASRYCGTRATSAMETRLRVINPSAPVASGRAADKPSRLLTNLLRFLHHPGVFSERPCYGRAARKVRSRYTFQRNAHY
jgi:hypothetical protein